MPFVHRIVDPIHVSRLQVGKTVTDELECVTNNSLANIIRQLSSLSHHAEDMFADLYNETKMIFKRATELNSRVEHLRVEVTQLNPTEEEVSLQNIHLRKPYQSSKLHDQQVVARITIPKAIQDLYNKCERPPALDKLNSYREDGKDCMKFYTDPSYFFELWYSQIQSDISKKRKELKEKRVKKDRTRPNRTDVTPKKIETKREKYAAMALGEELRPGYQVPDIRTGGNKPIPQGYTQHNTDMLPGDAHRHSVKNGAQHSRQDMQNHVSGNHIDKRGAQNGPYNVHPDYQSTTPEQNYQQQAQMQQQRQSQKMSPAQNQNYSPGTRQSQKLALGQTVNRPNAAPPPPPPGAMDNMSYMQRADRGSLSPQRDSMPPPPPPPLNVDQYGSPQHQGGMMNQMPPHMQYQQTQHGSPGMDLGYPPPPPPPLDNSMGTPPPPSPPPILNNKSPPHAYPNTSPAPPPPPPPPPPPGPMQPDAISVSSDNSTQSSLASSNVEPTPPPQQKQIVTARSALLDEIRLGNKGLRKTEERKRDTTPRDRFDVHAVMTKAFDMRRKAMEDSEDEEEDDNDEWD
ncbi:actin-binding protein WASF3-like [Mya arenaria]|uniref:actin-binding protein WASF3-like n=1 Tax=Mya arenaria TaxID=6604 RepID=UPI0022E89706|nr:actin-binding protein WASF3-like [Mya arenaria]XP_052808946.1 actin-binding protein WASF3-like [Mya arenaria]